MPPLVYNGGQTHAGHSGMGPGDRDPGPRRPPDPARLLRQPPRRRPALAPAGAGRRRVGRLGAVARHALRVPALHDDPRPRARRRGRLARPAPLGRRDDEGRRLGRRGETRRRALLGRRGGLPPDPRRGPRDSRPGEVHGPGVPELPRALFGNAAGRSLDVGKDDQLLLLGIPSRRHPAQALGRGADGRLQPVDRELRRASPSSRRPVSACGSRAAVSGWGSAPPA